MTGFREHAISGVTWTGASTAFGMALQFMQMAVLARFLAADAFGLFGEAMIVVGVALAFVDFGLSPALVQREGVSDETITSLFWLASGLSAICGFLVWVSANWLARFFGAELLADLIPIAALFVVLFGAGQVPLAVLQKHLAFDKLSKVDVVSALMGVATAILCATLGYDAHAPLYGLTVSGGVRLVGLLIASFKIWRPGFHFQAHEVRSFVSFGAYQTGERLVNYLAANLDFVIIGKFLGTSVLGSYYIAYQIVVQPMVRLSPVLTRVAFPLFSKVQHEDVAIRSGYVRIVKLVGFVTIPMLVGMAVVAPSFLAVYLGETWKSLDTTNVVRIVQILVPVSLLKCLSNPLGSAFLAKGRPDVGFILNGARLILNAVLFWTAISWGVTGVAWAYVMSSVLAFWAGYFVLNRILEIGLSTILRAITPTVFSATSMGILVALAQLGLSGIQVDPLHRLLFLISLGGTIYFVVIFRVERPLLMDISRWFS